MLQDPHHRRLIEVSIKFYKSLFPDDGWPCPRDSCDEDFKSYREMVVVKHVPTPANKSTIRLRCRYLDSDASEPCVTTCVAVTCPSLG